MVLVFSVLAASLAKMAFFSSEQQAAVSPGGAVTDPVVMVETATIVKDLSLQGKVARDVDVTLRATSTGSVTAVHVGDGGVVDAGQALVTVKLENGRSEDTVSPAQRSSGAAGDDHRRPCPIHLHGPQHTGLGRRRDERALQHSHRSNRVSGPACTAQRLSRHRRERYRDPGNRGGRRLRRFCISSATAG